MSESYLQPFAALKSKAAAVIPHTGEWCTGSGAAVFSKTTLKTVADRVIYGMLTYSATVGKSKLEASDVARVDDTFYVVCDSSWSILRLAEDLPMLSSANEVVDLAPGDAFTPPDGEV